MPAVVPFVAGMFSFGAGAAFAAGGTAFSAWVAGAAFSSTILGGIVTKLLTTVAISALTSALAPDPPQGGGITISATVRGEHQPETIMLGKSATAGQAICPPYSHGRSNCYLTHIIEVCSAPGANLRRFMLGDDWVELGGEADVPSKGFWDTLHDRMLGRDESDFGHVVSSGDYEGLVWVKYYDGSQTAADPMLLDRYGSDPDRPWTTEMIGTGICYAILTFKFDQERLTSVPQYRFELSGIPLYDRRKDGSAGGTGPHRLADPATWEPTENAAVIAWNVMRGIPLPGGEVWGGNITDLSELPWSVWTAAMNRCDAPITLSGGGTEPAYRAGLEVALDQPPAAALEEIFKACSATVADLGYGWGIVVGAPALPVYSFTDDDIIVSRQQELDPFPSIEETHNAVTARYPDPEALYETKEAPRRTNAAFEAADAFGRRMSNLALPAVPYKRQVQRLTRAWIEDARRFSIHSICLPPDAAHVELIDTVDWTSARNGYEGKDFSVHEIAEDPRTGIRQLSIRERDPNDYSWRPDFELPSVPTTPGTTPAAPEPVSGFAASAVILTDASGVGRRAAIRLFWASDILADGLRWQIRVIGQDQNPLIGSTQAVGDGMLTVAEGILPNTTYQIRARLIASRKTIWSDWITVTTGDVRIARDELEDGVLEDLDELLRWIDSTDELIAGIQEDMAHESDRVNGLVQGVRNSLTDEAVAIRQELTAGLASANGYAATAIETYDTTVQGRFAAMTGQIEQLTAALTSDNLVSNGRFSIDTSGWTLTKTTREIRSDSADTLVQASPEEAMIRLGSSGSARQSLNQFEVGEYDRLQLRFWAATSATSRTIRLDFEWLDSNGNQIGETTSHSLTVAPASQWKVYTAQFDPPDNAVGANLTINKPQAGANVLMTGIEAATVNIALEARVTTLEAARVTDQAALATWRSQLDVRFANTDVAISAEATARANADSAIGTRLAAIEAVNGTHAAAITQQATAIANTEEAITQLDERLAVQFGGTQLVRDPEFAHDLAFWSGALGDATRLVARNRASGNTRLSDMPGAKAFQIAHTDSGVRSTVWFPVSSVERYDLGAFFFREQAASPPPRCAVQWANEAGADLGSTGVNGTGAPGSWQYMSLTGVVPPAGATKGRVAFARYGGTAGLAWITGITLNRQAAFEVATAAEILTVKQAQANADSAFTAWRTTLESRIGSVEAVNSTQATQISDRYTRAQTDNAISAAITSTTATLTNQINQRATTTALNALTSRVASTEAGLSAQSEAITTLTSNVNRMRAGGRFRISTAATPTGAQARIGLHAEASDGDSTHSAALYLVAESDGTSTATIAANRFAVVTGTGANATRRTPFIIQGGDVWIDTARIRELTVQRLHVADSAITTFERAYTAGAILQGAVSGDAQTLTYTIGRIGPQIIHGSVTIGLNSLATGARIRVYRGSTLVYSAPADSDGVSGCMFTFVDTANLSGSVTYRMTVTATGNHGENFRLGSVSERFLGALNVYK